jgi:O-antigen/teichoic acid export membrane protein
VNSVILKNIGSNWVGMGVSLLIAFFMMPFLLMQLGPIRYGFWTFLQSVVSFSIFLDLGIRSSLVRYLAKAYAEKNQLFASQVFNVGLILYSIIGGVIILVTFGAGKYFPIFFEVESIDHQTVFYAVVLVGTSVGLSFPSAIFSAVLTGQQRYDLMNIAQICGILVRSIFFVWGLRNGFGILALAFATLLGTIVHLLLDIYFSKQVYTALCVKFSQWDWSIVKILSNHGFFSFIIVGSRGILTDAGIVLVGLFLGPAAVTVYSIGASLTNYANQLVSGITTTLTPAASALDANNSSQKLIKLSLNSAKLILLIGYSILITYLVSGDIFISLWLGKQFAVAYTPLILLSFCWAFFYLQSPFLVILIGLSRHKVPALLMLVQAFLSVGLGVFLVQTNGIPGVAWAAFIASVFTNSISMLYGLRALGVSFLTYLRKTLFPALLGLIPFGVTLTLLTNFYQPVGLFGYFSQITASMVTMGILLPWLGLDSQERGKILQLGHDVLERHLPQRFSKK